MRTRARMRQMAFVFTARSGGYLAGSIISGFIFDKYDGSLMLSVVLFVAAAGTALAPLCRTVPLLALAVITQGTAMGFLDTGGNVLLLALWGAAGAPYMQALHFAFGAGAFVSPLVAEPFLSRNRTISQQGALAPIPAGDSQVATAYFIASAPLFICGVWFVYFAVTNRRAIARGVSRGYAVLSSGLSSSRDVPATPDATGAAENAPEKAALDPAMTADSWRIRGPYRRQIITAAFFFFFLYVGVEVAYASYLATFAVQGPLRMSEPQAAVLTSAFWGAFAFGRLIAIFISMRVSSARMLLADLAGALFATILLTAAAKIEPAVWTASVLFGLSLASAFPTAFNLCERYIEVNSRAASFFVVGSSLGEMVLPLIVGTLLDNTSFGGPNTLPVGCLVFVILAIVVFAFLFWRGQHPPNAGTVRSALHAARCTLATAVVPAADPMRPTFALRACRQQVFAMRQVIANVGKRRGRAGQAASRGSADNGLLSDSDLGEDDAPQALAALASAQLALEDV